MNNQNRMFLLGQGQISKHLIIKLYNMVIDNVNIKLTKRGWRRFFGLS